MHIASTSTRRPQPERLPPTENAARYHIYRVHLQVLQWKLLSTACENPVDWGWTLQDNKYIPVLTDVAAAPDDLLNVVRCKCKAESRTPCGTSQCSCRKHGLKCVAACKNCNGMSCDNAVDHDYDLSDSEEGSDVEDNDVTGDVLEDNLDDELLECVIPWITGEVVGETKTAI